VGKLIEMLAGKGSIKVVELARAGTKVGLIPLPASEAQNANAAALQRLAELKVAIGTTPGWQEYCYELGVQTLFRALVDPETSEPLASSPDEVRKALNRGEIDYLSAHQGVHQESVSPPLESFPKEAMDELGEASPSASSSPGSEPRSSTPTSAFRRTS